MSVAPTALMHGRGGGGVSRYTTSLAQHFLLRAAKAEEKRSDLRFSEILPPSSGCPRSAAAAEEEGATIFFRPAKSSLLLHDSPDTFRGNAGSTLFRG